MFRVAMALPGRFLPVVAAVLTLRSISSLLEAVVVHCDAGTGVVGNWLVTLAAHGAKTLAGLDVIVREVSEVALITFM